jgi:Ca2+-binding RTX toxin-like protein
MMHLQHRHIRGGVLAGSLVLVMGLTGGATAAWATPCVVGPGVTQTETTVVGGGGNDTIDCGGVTPAKTITGNGGNDTITGTDLNDTITGGVGNDTITGGTGDDNIDGGLGIDTLSGSAGNDTIVGSSNDGDQDSLDGGLGIDACQGPAPDPDIHANCETTTTPPLTGPGSSTGNGGALCQDSGGLFIDLSPVTYTCVFLALNGQRRPAAKRICENGGGTFVDLNPLAYACVLP